MTVSISLTKSKITIIDDCDRDLAQHKWRENIGYAVREVRPNGTRESRTSQYLHRVILERMTGRKLKQGELCDHINRDGLDNRRCNLRLVDKSKNNANGIKKSNRKRFKGTTYNKQLGQWRAQVMKDYTK